MQRFDKSKQSVDEQYKSVENKHQEVRKAFGLLKEHIEHNMQWQLQHQRENEGNFQIDQIKKDCEMLSAQFEIFKMTFENFEIGLYRELYENYRSFVTNRKLYSKFGWENRLDKAWKNKDPGYIIVRPVDGNDDTETQAKALYKESKGNLKNKLRNTNAVCDALSKQAQIMLGEAKTIEILIRNEIMARHWVFLSPQVSDSETQLSTAQAALENFLVESESVMADLSLERDKLLSRQELLVDDDQNVILSAKQQASPVQKTAVALDIKELLEKQALKKEKETVEPTIMQVPLGNKKLHDNNAKLANRIPSLLLPVNDKTSSGKNKSGSHGKRNTSSSSTSASHSPRHSPRYASPRHSPDSSPKHSPVTIVSSRRSHGSASSGHSPDSSPKHSPVTLLSSRGERRPKISDSAPQPLNVTKSNPELVRLTLFPNKNETPKGRKEKEPPTSGSAPESRKHNPQPPENAQKSDSAPVSKREGRKPQ